MKALPWRPNYLPKIPFPNSITLWVTASMYELGDTIQFIAIPISLELVQVI